MKDLLIFAVILVLLAGIFFNIFNRFAKSANTQTQFAAQSIIKFPDSTSWEIKDNKNICITSASACVQPTSIIFDSPRSWNEIYSYYINSMQAGGWKTNSSILTSIPTSIVFTNEASCRAELSTYKPIMNIVNKPQNNKFKFSVACP